MRSTDAAQPIEVRRNPLSLAGDVLDKMLNLEIKSDADYTGLEIQVFDDESHGRGMLVFLSRAKDGRIDVYPEPGLRLDPAGYAIGNGLGEWQETHFAPARVEFHADGVDVDVGFRDHAGRPIRIVIDDRSGHTRNPASLLAPMGAAIRSPNRLPLVWMRRFDLVRHGAHLEVSIDGTPVRFGRLPGSFLHRRELVKYASDLFVVSVNPAYDGPIGTPVLSDVSVETGGHRARLEIDEGGLVEDLVDLEETRGHWRLIVDDAVALVGGSWSARKAGSCLTLDMDVLDGWRPRRLPVFMRLVTTLVAVFRRWPTTYRWHAEIDLHRRWMISGWERTDVGGDTAYQSLTSPSGGDHRARH
jgi:hypothetical protein